MQCKIVYCHFHGSYFLLDIIAKGIFSLLCFHFFFLQIMDILLHLYKDLADYFKWSPLLFVCLDLLIHS